MPNLSSGSEIRAILFLEDGYLPCLSLGRILWQTLLAFQINKQNLVFTCLIGEAKLKSVPGVVTSYSGDYGWTESLISFNADVVTCDEPLSVWQTVTADVEY